MQKKYRKIKRSIRLDRVAILTALFFVPVIILIILLVSILHKKEVTVSNKCHTGSKITLLAGIEKTVKGTTKRNSPNCFYFNASSEDEITFSSKNKITFSTPKNYQKTLQGSSSLILSDSGTYSIVINTDQDVEDYQITLKLESKNLFTKPPVRIIEALPYKHTIANDRPQLIYNVVKPPSLKPSSKLQTIVNDIVSLVQSKGLPIDRLSVSLIELNSSECCAYGQYLDKELRFPASVAKLFWMVYLYGKYEAKMLPEGSVPYKNLAKMIQESDNESASLIVDTITQTKSGENLPSNEFNKWIQKRLLMNSFFEQAGYYPTNISQKLFPTDYQKNDAPTGRDLQIRGDESYPYRNYTTTYNVARLLLEIYQEKAISKKYSQSMKLLLKRNLHPSAWQNKEFNAIAGFLGEALPENAYFASKMGWNFNTRNDAAIIGTPDGKHKYILVVFGDDPSFYKDKNILPALSSLVYERMRN